MTPPPLGTTLRVHRPHPKIRAFYDGRLPGAPRFHAAENWLDDGALGLGLCSYAIVDGGAALVYDTHASLAHGCLIRASLEAEGARIRTVVLSHWHTDHVAGNAAFADLPILANRRTAELLAENRATLESGTPPIRPLIEPTEIFDTDMEIMLGATRIELRRAEIHSPDATVLLMDGILLAGDTLEDPVTYVDDAEDLPCHLEELARMDGWDFTTILPAHGAEAVIAAGGYDRRLLDATRRYVARLLADPEPEDLASFCAADIASGAISYFPAYEAVHRANLAKVRKQRSA